MWISMSLWYPEAQAAKELGYLFLKTPWWFQFSLAYPHSTMNLHLSTKRKPIEASEILSARSYFHFQGASFSSSFRKKKGLLLHLRSYGKRWVKFLLKKASRWSHFRTISVTEKFHPKRGVLWGSSKTLEASRKRRPIPNQTRETGNPGIPTCQPVGFKEHTSCRKNVMKGRDVNMRNRTTQQVLMARDESHEIIWFFF